MMGKAPISTGLRRQAAGDACIVGTIGAREDGSGAKNRRITAAAIEDLHGDGVGDEPRAAFRSRFLNLGKRTVVRQSWTSISRPPPSKLK
jgi:hypothetical protein